MPQSRPDPAGLAQRAHDLLRSEILTCRIEPGARINISEMQTRFTLSQAAVREALSRLTAEGLVVSRHNRGFLAAPISLGGFRDLTEACTITEMACLRKSIENGDHEWELNLVATFQRSLHTLEMVADKRAEVDAYFRERLNFYEALLGACDNPWLLRSWRMLYAQNVRFRHIYYPLAEFELGLNDLHRQVMDAVLARDADLAVKLSQNIYQSLVQFVEENLAPDQHQHPQSRYGTSARVATG